MTNVERIAFLGVGAMGSRMATRLIAAGCEVVVWNRSGVRGDLKQRAASTPREAATGADLVISMVTDDAASQDTWDDPQHGALAGLAPSAIAIECSTLTPARISALSTKVGARGAQLLDAPVVGSRPQAEAGTLTFLVGGDGDVLARAHPVLTKMGGVVCHVGPRATGAVMKLVVNALFGVQVAALAELLGVTRRAGIPMATVLETLGALPVLSPAAKAAAGGMIAGRFEPQFPVKLAAKDLRYVLSAASVAGIELPVTSRVHEVFAAAVAAGLSDENLTAIAKRYP